MTSDQRPSRSLADAYLRLSGRSAGRVFGDVLSAFADSTWTLPEPFVSPGVNRFVEHFRRQVAGSLRTVRFLAGLLPPNLREVGSDFSIVAAVDMGREEGIGLYGVPRAALARRFLVARDSTARRRLLGDAGPLILDDCDSALDGATAAGLEFTVVMLRDAIRAARAGHVIAAQAAATAALDGATRRVFDDKKVREALTRTGPEKRRRQGLIDGLSVREALAFAPVYGVHENYRHWEAAAPWLYSRHATAHSAARRQFSKRNAVQAILVATGLILWVDDAAKGRTGL